MNHRLTAADLAEVAKAENAAARKGWGTVRWNSIGTKYKHARPPARKSPVANAVMTAIADGHATRGDIAAAAGTTPERAGTRLKDLARAGLVSKSGARHRMVYALTDAGREWLEGRE